MSESGIKTFVPGKCSEYFRFHLYFSMPPSCSYLSLSSIIPSINKLLLTTPYQPCGLITEVI